MRCAIFWGASTIILQACPFNSIQVEWRVCNAASNAWRNSYRNNCCQDQERYLGRITEPCSTCSRDLVAEGYLELAIC